MMQSPVGPSRQRQLKTPNASAALCERSRRFVIRNPKIRNQLSAARPHPFENPL